MRFLPPSTPLVAPWACAAWVACALWTGAVPTAASAHEASAPVPSPAAWAVDAPVSTEAPVPELKFAEFFQRPIGPRGLTPSAQLLALAGQRVRIVGYMAAAELPMPGRLVLAPMPLELGDEDEHLADDLPPQAVFVHLSGPAAQHTLPNYRGLLALTGRLEIGAREEPDGHVSTVRLLLDESTSAAGLPAASAHTAHTPSTPQTTTP